MNKYGFDLPDCFGCREQAWDECETCKWIMNCSFETLKINFGDKITILADDRDLEPIHFSNEI
jgi:hypothetical protein